MGERELSQGAAAAYERKDHTGALSLYIHFPFCVRKCAYCDFLSAPADEETREAYVDALAREIKTAGERIAAQQPGHVQYVDTIYFGGGTPSLMTSAQTDHLLTAVAMSFLVADDAEISAECNPGTADQEKLAAWRSMGINRLSIGAQSFHDDDLKRLGRIHTAAQIGQTFRAARQAGFTNISMDLISSLPGQTTGRAKEDLCSAMALMPEHLSVYSLIIEEDTPFRDMYGSRETAPDPAYLPLPDEDTEREIYHRTWQLLEEGGYRQYEISSAARPGYECFHNIGYWKGHEYLGFGLGAASLYGGARWSNTPDLQEYTEAMSAVPQRDIRRELSVLTEKDRLEEFMFLGLRMTDGISEEVFAKTFGKTADEVYGDVIRKQTEQGMLERSGGRLFFTERGVDISNTLMAEYMF